MGGQDIEIANPGARLSGLEHASLFHDMALAPAEPVDIRSTVLATVTAIALGGVATAIFRRRDLQTG